MKLHNHICAKSSHLWNALFQTNSFHQKDDVSPNIHEVSPEPETSMSMGMSSVLLLQNRPNFELRGGNMV